MAKETKKTREELIAEANQQAKAAGSKTNEAATDDETSGVAPEPDEPLSPEAQKAAAAIIAESEEEAKAGNVELPEESDPAPEQKSERTIAAETALKKLRRIHAAYSPAAPNEFICFGNGGDKFTLGDLRALIRVMPPE